MISGGRSYPAVVMMGDGGRYSGFVSNFHPNAATLRLKEVDRGGSMIEIHDLDMYEVLTVFFVRELGLMRSFRRAEPSDEPPPPGPIVQVQMTWGETLVGVPDGPLGNRRGFFLKPVHRTGNLVSVYISRQAVAKILPGNPAIAS